MRAIKFADIGREIPRKPDLRLETPAAPAGDKIVAGAPAATAVPPQPPQVKSPQHP